MLTEKSKLQLNEIQDYEKIRTKIISTNQSIETKAGNLFEELHKTDFNCDSINKGNTLRAFTDRSQGSPIHKNDPVCDIAIYDTADSSIVTTIQAKAKTPKNTYNSLCRPDSTHLNPYTLADGWLCTSESRNYISQKVSRRLAVEEYRAANGDPRPLTISNYNECKEKTVDCISVNKVSSTPLSLEAVKSEVQAPWYSDKKRNEMFSSHCAESYARNKKYADSFNIFPHATITAVGNFFGDTAEAKTVFLKRKEKRTGCFVNCAVNSIYQGTNDMVRGIATGQQKKQIVFHTSISIGEAVANGVIGNSSLKGGISFLADITHLLVDLKFSKKSYL